MTGDIWLKLLVWFDKQLSKDSILLADNCPAHVNHDHLTFKYLKIHYLPPNTTSIIQPMDAGIIRSFKAFYRKNLVKYWINLMDKNTIRSSSTVV